MKLVFSFLMSLTIACADVVKWLPDKSFSLANNFKNHKRPCSKQTVVFPKVMYESTSIDSDISISGMVLPKEGSLTIDAAIIFGPNANDNCTEEGTTFFVPNSIASWIQPDVWFSERFNKATPDAERVPCFDDIVQFSEHSEFTIKLPDFTQSVKGIKFGSQRYFTNTQSFKQYVLYEQHPNFEFVLSWYDTGIVINPKKECKSRSGCPCQEKLQDMDCTLKYCQVPKCVDPIQPIGHCCKICGGYLTINIDGTFEIMEFKEKVMEILELYGKDDFHYHIGRLPGNIVQLVIVDKNDYTLSSALAVHSVKVAIDSSYVKVDAVYSGNPLSLSGMSAKIAVSMFFMVILVMGGIYAYYYKMPEVRFPVTLHGNVRGVVSRFNRRTDSVVSLTSRRDSEVPIGTGGGTSFRNPLYDSKRGRIHIDESVNE